MVNLKNFLLINFAVTFLIFTAWTLYVSVIFPKHHYNQLESRNNSYPIVVLTGGKGRIEKGLELLKNGYGNLLFVSGVHPDVDIKKKYFSETTEKKFNDCCIFFGKKAKDTIGNLKEVDEWLLKNNFNEFYLVSSYYHLPRVKFLFENHMPYRNIYLIPVGEFSDLFSLNLNQSFTIKILIFEFLKLSYLIIFGS
ncbi:MAG: hypothetical protein CMM96_03710 [Rickettsiales bacterium]|nr:hypothetical protein [Rickettsiales bacterium]